MKHQDLQNRTKQFALQVIKFCERLTNDETSKILRRQLLRAGTSVGANYRAACRAKSKPAFISKLGVHFAFCIKKKRAGRQSALCNLHFALPPGFAISTKNKHLLLSCDTNPRFHGGSFGVYGHTSCKALKL